MPKKNRRIMNPLKGKLFYFDLKNNYPLLPQVKDDIVILGGNVEPFLSRAINYVITDSPLQKSSSPDSGFASSPTPSLYSTSGSSVPSSPILPARRKLSLTRGEKMLQLSSAYQAGGTTDIDKICQEWGIKVLTLSHLQAWLQKVEILKDLQEEWKEKQKIKTLPPRQLQTPHIKMEDDQQLYRPEYKVLKESWPAVHVWHSKLSEASSWERKNVRFIRTFEDTFRFGPARTSKIKEDASHYCEMCGSCYKSPSAHLQTPSHFSFTESSEKFHKVEKAISQFPNLHDFIKTAIEQPIEQLRSPR